MKRIIVLSLMALIAFAYTANAAPPSKKIKWYTLEEAIEAAQKSPKPILIDMYTDWCGWCKKLDADTFSHDGIAQYINSNFYPVKFNAEQKEAVTYLGKEYKPNGERTHPLALTLTGGRLSYPMLLYMKADGTVITAVPGYTTPQQLEPILHFIATRAYEAQEWEVYSKNFKSEF